LLIHPDLAEGINPELVEGGNFEEFESIASTRTVSNFRILKESSGTVET